MRSCTRTLVFAFLTMCAIARPAGAEEIRFVDVTRPAGLYKPLAGMLGHGGAWGDVDGDGDLDLYVGGFADRPNADMRPAAGPLPNKLFLNRGNGTFEPVTDSPATMFARTSGAVFADLDNNGTADLYVANNCRGKTRYDAGPQREAQLARSKLFRNSRGKLTSAWL